MQEKRYEKRLIRELKSNGYYAVHLEPIVPGFPDIFAARNGKIILIEMKDLERGSRPEDIFEKSQPPLYYELWRRTIDVYLARGSPTECILDLITFAGGDLGGIQLANLSSTSYADAVRVLSNWTEHDPRD